MAKRTLPGSIPSPRIRISSKAVSFSTLFKGILFVGFAISISRFCLKQTDGFSIHAITSNHVQDKAFQTRTPTLEEEKELEQAFAQPYVYFGCGGQAFAFFSADGRYVIKFFKQRLYHPSLIETFWKRRKAKRLDKCARDFFSYRVGWEELKEETGLLYVHLHPTQHLSQRVEFIDRLHISHFLDLNRYDFVVQRRAEMVYDRIERLMRAQQLEAAKQSIASLFSLIRTRAEKGFKDRDPNIRTNCGFIDDKAVKIDVGRFVRDPTITSKAKEEIQRIAAPFREWIEQNHPSLLKAFDEELTRA